MIYGLKGNSNAQVLSAQGVVCVGKGVAGGGGGGGSEEGLSVRRARATGITMTRTKQHVKILLL